jgi:hypothetical protein
VLCLISSTLWKTYKTYEEMIYLVSIIANWKIVNAYFRLVAFPISWRCSLPNPMLWNSWAIPKYIQRLVQWIMCATNNPCGFHSSFLCIDNSHVVVKRPPKNIFPWYVTSWSIKSKVTKDQKSNLTFKDFSSFSWLFQNFLPLAINSLKASYLGRSKN